MHPTLVAQVDLAAKGTGLLAQIIAGGLGLAVSWGTIVFLWRMFEAMTKNPSIGGLLGIVVVLLFAVFLIGAAPDMLDAAYAYGQSFMDS